MLWLSIVLYVLAPFPILRARKAWSVPLAILLLWAPIEFGLWTRYGLSPLAAISIAIITAIVAFSFRPDVIDIRKSFQLSREVFRGALQNWLLFGIVAVPLGLWIGFIHFTFSASELPGLPLLLVTIFVFNALPEEILFRGLVQNWIERNLGSQYAALVLASLIFGAAHLNNGSPIPNWKYFLMASLAGIFYGRAWRTRKNLIASTLTHTFVNTCWSLFFR